MIERCVVYHVPGPNGGTFRFIRYPTIGDVRNARRNNAIILFRLVERKGKTIAATWVTDDGRSIIVSMSEAYDE